MSGDAMEIAERVAEAARAVDRAAGDPWGVRVMLRRSDEAVERAEAKLAAEGLTFADDDKEEAS